MSANEIDKKHKQVICLREKNIEGYLRDQAKKFGGRAYKFESPGNIGVPDRLVVFPGGRIFFVELKAPGKKPRPNQILQMRRLSDLECNVRVIDSKEGVDDLMLEVILERSLDDRSIPL